MYNNTVSDVWGRRRPHRRHVDPPSQQFDKRVSKFVQNINGAMVRAIWQLRTSQLQSGARPMLHEVFISTYMPAA